MVTFQKNDIQKLRIIREGDTFVTSLVSVRVPRPHTPKEEVLRVVFAHMLQSGSEGYTRDEFTSALCLLGAHILVTASDEHITISLKARNEVVPKVLALYKTMLTKPVWSNKELKRVKEYLTNQLVLAKEDARSRAREYFINSFIQKTDWRYSYESDVLTKALVLISTKDLKDFHSDLFNRKYIATTGGSAFVCEKVERTILSLPFTAPTSLPSTILPVATMAGQKLVLTNIPHKQNIEFSIGGAVPFTMDDTAFPAFIFGVNVLGIYGGFTGRLMSTVREKEGLTYMIYAGAEDITKVSHGYWRISTFFSPVDCIKGITSTLREIELISSKGISEDELKRFKNILSTRYLLTGDSLVKSVSAMHARQNGDVSEEEHSEFLLKNQKLTISEVNDALRTYLNPKNIVVSGAGPIKTIENDLKKLLKIV